MLDSYFNKFGDHSDDHTSGLSGDRTEKLAEGDVLQSKKGLASLEDYLGKLNQGTHPLDSVSFVAYVLFLDFLIEIIEPTRKRF